MRKLTKIIAIFSMEILIKRLRILLELHIRLLLRKKAVWSRRKLNYSGREYVRRLESSLLFNAVVCVRVMDWLKGEFIRLLM